MEEVATAPTSTVHTSTGITYNRPVSALEDSENYNIRHPLQNKWTLWYRASTKTNSAAVKNSAKSDNWEASLQCVNTVDTIEDFWGMYNNVPGIDKMEDSSDYMFFKEGIRPAWEDPANANGGSYTLQIKGSLPGIGEFVWLNTLMMAVGSTLTHFDQVTGIVFAKRSNRSDRISLWLSSSDREVCRQCETEWMELLQKVNSESFNLGSTSFTNHKGSSAAPPHRGDRVDHREGGNRDREGGHREGGYREREGGYREREGGNHYERDGQSSYRGGRGGNRYSSGGSSGGSGSGGSYGSGNGRGGGTFGGGRSTDRQQSERGGNDWGRQ